MNLGELNRKVTVIWRDPDATDDHGQPVESWITFAQPWARIRNSQAGTENEKAGTVMSTARCEIRVRYRTDITPAMRIAHKGNTYRIVAVRPNEMNREWTDIDCELIV